jgi:hypothetical protein
LSSLWVELPLRRLIGVLMLLGFSWLHAQQPLSGTYNITGNSDPDNGEFATIQEAFRALEALGVDPPGVTFRVQDSWVSSPNGRDLEPGTIELRGYNSPNANNPSEAPVTLTFEELSRTVYFAKDPSSQFIFRFSGSIKYFTLDGARQLILKSTAPGGAPTGLIGFVSSSSQGIDLDIDAITIKNVIMHGNRRDNTFVGVYIGNEVLGESVTPGSNIGADRGIIIQGCTIDSVSRPILVAGRRENTRNIKVLDNKLGHPTETDGWCADPGIGAIHIQGTVGVTVSGNVVHPQRSSNHSVAGIRLDFCEAATIERNWIKGVVYTGTSGVGAYGIALNLPDSYNSADPQTTVLNNMIAGIYADGNRSNADGSSVISGIWVTAPSDVEDAQVRLIHNSINLFDDPDLSDDPEDSHVGASSGITLGSSIQGGVVIDGNLIQNKLSPRQRRDDEQAAYGILIYNSSLASSTINYQCYRINATPANNYIGCLGDPATADNNHATLSDWQAAIGGEANGIDHAPAGDVPFLSNIDLHLDPEAPSLAISAGNPAYNGDVDFDGEERPIGGGPDPGDAPDIGADELAGTPSCPRSLQAPEIVVTATHPPLEGSDYLWGQQVEIGLDPDSPAPIGDLIIIYSLDEDEEEDNWTLVQSVSRFPVTITLPSLTPSTYRGTLQIAVVATAPDFCGLEPDTSNIISINLTDRLGNRADNAIEITLRPSDDDPGIWTATIPERSTDGPGLSDEYTDLPRAQAALDLFFRIQLPACLDSLDISLCSSTGTLTDSYIHLINATATDTIDSDNGCSAGFLSRIVAIGKPNANTRNADPLSEPARDSLLLVEGHTIYLVVEGSNLATGTFTVNITGYKMRPSSINVTGAPSGPVCINSDPITLDATTPGATAYQWLVNDIPIQGATSATYTIPTNAEGSTIVKAQAIFDDPNGAVCSPVEVLSSPVTITVEDTARAQIVDASDTPVGGTTLTITAGSTVTLNAKSLQNPDNSYTWKRYKHPAAAVWYAAGLYQPRQPPHYQ